MAVAVGEFGYHETGSQRQADFLPKFYDQALRDGYIGAAYFDYGESLLGGPSIKSFDALIAKSTSVLAK
jgi:hypothetical protein